MRVPERYWWLVVVFGCGMISGAVALPAIIFSQLVPLDQELGNSLTSDYLLAGGSALFMLVFAAVFLTMGLRGRARYRRRRAALAGDLAAIPLANVPLVLAPPDLADGPLVLSWRATTGMRFVMGQLLLLQVLVGCAEGLISPVFSVIAIVQAIQTSAGLSQGDLVMCGISVVCLVALVIGGYFVVRYLPTLFGRPYGVRATAEGLEERTQLGRKVFIRWEELRLFELEVRSSSFRRYWVYGERASIEWRDSGSSPDGFALDGPSVGEMVLRLSSLVALVHARTGLAPRTFSKSLRALDESAPFTPPHSASGAGQEARATLTLLILGIGVALVTGALGAAVWLLPLTSSPLLNGAVALPLVGLAAVLLVVVLVRLARGAPSPQLVPLVAPPAGTERLASDTDGVYTLVFRLSLPFRLLLALMGLLLIIDLVPVVLTFMSMFNITTDATLGANLPSVSPGDGIAVAYVLIMYGVVGLGLLVAALSNEATTIRADALGLSTGTGATAVALPWASITGVEERMREGQVVGYIARERDGARSISWSARATAWQRMAPARDAQSITPEQLAGLVVARIAQFTYRAPHP